MKKFVLFLSIFAIILLGGINIANASEVCMGVSGCEGETSPREYPYFFSTETRCSWYAPGTYLYFDECRLGGNWFYYGPDDTGEVDGYVCYNCDNLGENCNIVRNLINGNSRLVCYNCDCRDYLSNFPPPICSPITGNKCVDEKCCVQGDSFVDFRDGETYTGNHGKYTSCVSHARNECGLIPSKESQDIQREAGKSKLFNPSLLIDVVIIIILILVIYIACFLGAKRKKKNNLIQ